MFIQSTALAASSKVALATFTPALDGVTVVRTRMTVMWSSDQRAVTETPQGAIGAAVMDNTAIAAGVASLSDPVTDIDDDIWFVFQGLVSLVGVNSAIGFQEPALSQYEIDSKAMRKVPAGKSMVVIAANASSVGARVGAIIRVYTKLKGS